MPAYRYDPAFVAAQYDRFAEGEWLRLTSSPIDEVNLRIHAHYCASSFRAAPACCGRAKSCWAASCRCGVHPTATCCVGMGTHLIFAAQKPGAG